MRKIFLFFFIKYILKNILCYEKYIKFFIENLTEAKYAQLLNDEHNHSSSIH